MLSFSGHVYHIKFHVNTPVVFRKCFLNHWNVVEDIHYRNREEYGRTDVMKVGLSYRSNYRFVFLSNCLLLDSILPSSSYRSPFLCCFKFQSKCRHLPALHELPRLQKLTLQRLNCLEYIDDDQNTATSCDIIPFFPSLKVLCILWCPKLTSMPLFPSLEWLVLQDTSSKPLLGTMMMAHKEASSGASPSSSFQSLSKLVEMTIVDIDDLQSLPQEGVAYLSSLQSLQISSCPNLTSLPESIGNLSSSLRSLQIRGCPNLTLLPESIGNLSSLRFLYIWVCPNLNSLPEAMGNLSSLQSLEIRDCPNLNSLPEAMGNLSSLQSLKIVECPNLNSLPEGQMLRALMKLSIKRCPMLQQRYNKTSGVDWPKIAHIPNVEFE
nr:putative disease resistance protein RGA4 [Ziziphus jujuba var. spinosa]XP_048331745.1 putative disease resistance protein RGA4 [Ziziphus jujuba var. spinosa]XP_048331746.1 putative disease resistance protein RGA4 [Ziziphus jujuba var. spinosa]XP_048331747.1 putative disease resistance protein RGA4 [Ziziphus jujuba var. spinosa]XP_048331748.1 putative disease resistance protein RGA4 [Ziziphus jujuba var. spinosa]XP_048331749.1 putative disease resistance protein RGA4 [Ziziphus jujuba var. sp